MGWASHPQAHSFSAGALPWELMLIVIIGTLLPCINVFYLKLGRVSCKGRDELSMWIWSEQGSRCFTIHYQLPCLITNDGCEMHYYY